MTTDDNLGASSRALLDAARPAMGPDAEAARRMRARIAASVGGTAAVGATAKAALGVKLATIAAIAVVVGIGAIVAVHARGGDDVDPVVAPSVPSAVPVQSPVAAPVVVVEPPPVVAPTEAREVELPAIDVGASRARAKPVASAITLAREVELVDRAMAALKSSDARGALAAIQIYDSEAAGRGQLAEDAAALEVEALCSLHDPTAGDRHAAFDRRFPHSAQSTHLATACR